MTEQERDDTLVAVQTKNVMLTAANTELLRQLRVAERKAAALDWLEEYKADVEHMDGYVLAKWNEDDMVVAGTLMQAVDKAQEAEAAMKAEEKL